MRSICVFLVMAVGSTVALTADPLQDEKEIRAAVKKIDAGEQAGASFRMDDRIFVSGAFIRPSVGRGDQAPRTTANKNAGQRKNQRTDTEIVRIVVASSGDMAYEYSNFRLQFDDNNGHSDRPGSALRVWRKVNDKWLIAAEFERPNTDSSTPLPSSPPK
jgi:ketosteroid isomerase-like protein